jgi:threonine/homoserine/homoserine lactone efflux protein
MNGIEIVVKGLIAGLVISASVGPVNVLCISRALSKGRRAGLISGMGAATADTIYGAFAAFSIGYIIRFMVREEFWIRSVGGAALIVIGLVYYFRPSKPLEASGDSSGSDFLTAFLLNLTNPTTTLSFLAVLAALGVGGYRGWLSLYLVEGIFTSAMVWWIFVALIAGHFQGRFPPRGMLWMNRIGGIAIGLFGTALVILSLVHRK